MALTQIIMLFDSFVFVDHRNHVWETLAEKFGSSVEDIRNKWRNIRDAYQKSLKKKAHCIDNNTMELYKAYKYDDQLMFLKHFCSATIKGAKRKSTSQDDRYVMKINKLFNSVILNYLIFQIQIETKEIRTYLQV